MKKTNKKIFIIIIVVAIVFVIGGVAFTFLGKSNNKEEFLKNAEQIFDTENGFIDNRINLLNDKKNATQYETIGKITVNVDNENINSNVADELNNSFNISFAGNVDNSNELAEYLVKINYSKNVNFPVLYKKVGKLQGIKSDKIYKNYFVTEKSNISSLFSNEAIEYEEIETENTSTNSNFKNEFINILRESFQEKSFSKVSTQSEEGYVLDIENEKLTEIIDKTLEKLKEDKKLLDKLKLNSNYVDFLKSLLMNNNLLKDKASITLYQKDKQLNRIVLEINGLLKLDVKKVQNGDTTNYNMSLTTNINNNNINLNVDVSIDGLNELETVNQKYTIDLNYNDYIYSFNIDNKTSFTDVIIEQFAEGEYTNIDKLSATKQQKLFQAIGAKFVQSNLELIKQIGINNQNVLISLLPNGYSMNYEENKIEEKEEKNENTQNNTNNTTNTNNTIGDNTTANTTSNSTSNNTTNSNTTTGNTTSDLATSFNETEKKVFNSNFEKYTGYNMDGNKLKSAIMEVIANNMSDEERQIKVVGVVTLTGNEVPEGIEATKKYSIELKYSDEGFVNKMIVSEKRE